METGSCLLRGSWTLFYCEGRKAIIEPPLPDEGFIRILILKPTPDSTDQNFRDRAQEDAF